MLGGIDGMSGRYLEWIKQNIAKIATYIITTDGHPYRGSCKHYSRVVLYYIDNEVDVKYPERNIQTLRRFEGSR
jgi:hypothetical protein